MTARSTIVATLLSAGALSLSADALAQNAPATPATAAPAALGPTEERPIDEFDLTRALVSETGGLTAEDVAKKARARSPQIMSARAAATSAEWDAKGTWSNLLPNLQVFAQYKRISEVKNSLITPEQLANLDPMVRPLVEGLFGKGDTFTQPLNSYSVGAQVRYPVSDVFLRIWPAYEAQSTAVDARKIQIEAAEAQVAQQARDAFYNYARAVAMRIVQEQSVKQAQAQADQTKLFVDAGTAAPVELMAATATLEGQRGTLARTEGMVEVARTAVATLAGLNKADVQGITEPVTDLPAAPSLSEQDLVAKAIEQRAEARALRQAARAAGLLEKAERRAAWPSLVLEANGLYANPNPRKVPPKPEFVPSWDVGATLAWTPNQWLTSSQRGNKQAAELAKTRADLAALEDAIRIEVVQAYQDYLAADAAARASESQLKAAEEAYRVRMAMYRVGAGVRLDLIQADQTVTQARFQYASSAIDARAALSRLRRAAALD